MLAFLPPQRVTAMLRQAVPSAPLHADGTPVDIPGLIAELEDIRQRGFATSRSERVLGAASAAAPVYDHHGDVIASVSVAGVTVRHGPDHLLHFGGLVKHCADRLSAELGYAAPLKGR
jgi:DNA-binding IclR family transcriptional regulator